MYGLTRCVAYRARTLAAMKGTAMPRRGEPLRKLGFLTIGRFDAADPGPGIEETLQVIERAEALGFDSVWLRDRHLQPGISSPVAIMAAASQRTVAHRTRHRRHPAGPGEPVPAGRGPGHRRHPVRRPDQPRCVGGHADALRPLQDRAVPRIPTTCEDFSKDRVLRLLRCLRGEPVSDFAGHRRHRAVHRPHPAALPRPGRPGLVRRRSGVGGVGGRAGHQLPDQFGGQHRGHRVAATSPPSRASRSTPSGPATRGPKGRGCHRDWWSSRPTRRPTTRSGATASTRRADSSAPRRPQGPRGMLFSPDYVGPPTNSPTSCSSTPGSSAPTRSRSRCRSPSSADDYPQIVDDLAEIPRPRARMEATQ